MSNETIVGGGIVSAAREMPDPTGNALEYVRVNAGATGYETVVLAGGGDLVAANNLSDVANAQTAINNITAVAGATNEHVLTKDTATGNAVFKAAGGSSAVRSVSAQFGGPGGSITAGDTVWVRVPYTGTITKVSMLADASGSMVVDIWKDTYANYPPTVADTIVAAAKPTLSAANKSEDSTLTGWTTAVTAGDVLKFNVDSVSGLTQVSLLLEITP